MAGNRSDYIYIYYIYILLYEQCPLEIQQTPVTTVVGLTGFLLVYISGTSAVFSSEHPRIYSTSGYSRIQN